MKQPEELEWTEIKDEEYRCYTFPGGEQVVIENVVKLCVRPSGNHRLEDRVGNKFIVAAGWLCLEFKAPGWSA